jgi:hypothetical protein
MAGFGHVNRVAWRRVTSSKDTDASQLYIAHIHNLMGASGIIITELIWSLWGWLADAGPE